MDRSKPPFPTAFPERDWSRGQLADELNRAVGRIEGALVGAGISDHFARIALVPVLEALRRISRPEITDCAGEG